MKGLIVAVVGIGHRTGRHGQCPDDRGTARAPKLRRATPISRISARTAPSWSGRTARPRGGRAWRGPDPGGAVASAMRRCEERNKQGCALYAVNNYTVSGKGMASAGAGARRRRARHRPAAARTVLVDARPAARDRPDRVEPRLHGGQERDRRRAATLDGPLHGVSDTTSIVSIGSGSTTGRAMPLRWPTPWRKARQLGYRRVLLAGQSAGAWVSLAALQRGGAGRRRDLDLRRPPRRGDEDAGSHARTLRMAEHVIGALKPGPKVVLVNFAGDSLRRRRPHGRCTLGLRQERRRRRDRRRAGRLQGPRRRQRLLLRPQVRPLHPGLHRTGQQAAALLGRIPTACTRRH